MASSRLRMHYCKVIIATSLVWVMVDVFVLMYYTDCSGADGHKCAGQCTVRLSARVVTSVSYSSYSLCWIIQCVHVVTSATVASRSLLGHSVRACCDVSYRSCSLAIGRV